MLDIIPVQIGEELLHPLIHNLVIGPAVFEFVEKDGSALSGFVFEGGEYGGAEVLFDGFAVALVEVSGPVVGGSLVAHVVASYVYSAVVRGLKGGIETIIEGSFQYINSSLLDHVIPAILQLNDVTIGVA